MGATSPGFTSITPILDVENAAGYLAHALEELERRGDPATLALAWLLADPNVSVVIGPRRPEQLAPALAALANPLTPTERDVVRLVSEGLTNKDIATRLFVSPRTVQSHPTHVYTKLGLTSRVELVQAARHR